MVTKEELLKTDKNLFIICEEIRKRIFHIKSIMLIGSRSINEEIELPSLNSDYDIIIVMRTPFIPIYYRKIKNVEKYLSKKIEAEVTINPLPFHRIMHPKGNYFLYKTGKDGISLYGSDYKNLINSTDIKEIDKDWYFFYLTFLGKELIFSFDPTLLFENNGGSKFDIVIYSSIKSLVGCGELLLLTQGIYESKPERILKEISKPKYGVDEKYLSDLTLALDIKKNRFVYNDPIGLWFSAKRHLLKTFQILMKKDLIESRSYRDLIFEYLENSADKSSLKNLQFFGSTLLIRREIHIKALFSRYLIDDRVRVAIFWLLFSIEENRKLNKECLLEAYRILQNYMNVGYSQDEIMLWRELKKALEIYFPHACTALGVW